MEEKTMVIKIVSKAHVKDHSTEKVVAMSHDKEKLIPVAQKICQSVVEKGCRAKRGGRWWPWDRITEHRRKDGTLVGVDCKCDGVGTVSVSIRPSDIMII